MYTHTSVLIIYILASESIEHFRVLPFRPYFFYFRIYLSNVTFPVFSLHCGRKNKNYTYVIKY